VVRTWPTIGGAVTTAAFFKDTVGPTTNAVTVASSTAGAPPTINATVFDNLTGKGVIKAAEYFIDLLGAPGTGVAMLARDGSLNTTHEAVTGVVAPGVYFALGNGTHTIYVRGQDALGNWGSAATTAFVKDALGPVASAVTASPNSTSTPPTISAQIDDRTMGGNKIKGAEFFIDSIGAAGTGISMSAKDGTFNTAYEKVLAAISTAIFSNLSQGLHTIYLHGQDAAGNWGAMAGTTFTKLGSNLAALSQAQPVAASAAATTRTATFASAASPNLSVSAAPASQQVARLVPASLASSPSSTLLGERAALGRSRQLRAAQLLDAVFANWRS